MTDKQSSKNGFPGENSVRMNEYDRSAEEQGWHGPEVVFGLSYAYMTPGETLLDIGTGTGLAAALFHKAGLFVHGMDISPPLLNICRVKRITVDLKEADLRVEPYPYEAASMDHAVCVGVLNFFRDPGPVFREAGRILREGAIFAFTVGDRAPGEEAEIPVGREHTGSDERVTMYRHGEAEVAAWLEDCRFTRLRSLGFSVPLDRERTVILPARAYVVRRNPRD